MSLRHLPSVERLLQTPRASELIATFGRPLVLQAIQETLESARLAIRQGEACPEPEAILAQTQAALKSWLAPTLRPVINATGVILHTNLGRAPLSRAAQQAMLAAAGYGTLEYDLDAGARGRRGIHAEALLRRLTGAEAAFVVNNNAAAVLLALAALARGKQVVVSRSQLVEIGGGFRIPDVMKQSGAKLVEVGTTNRTHLEDFEAVLGERSALILRAHHSNFKIIGFTAEPTLAQLVELGHRHGVPVMDDLGSGALLDTALFGLGHEPTVQESLQAGAAVVCFSGDKLLGGPQAGILVGQKAILDHLRRHPLARPVRPDKLCLGALAATLTHYLRDEAVREIPVWQMISASAEDLHSRAQAWAKRLGEGEILPGRSTVGGGSLPEETLPTWLLTLPGAKPDVLARELRLADPPVIARIERDRLALDPRTVLPEQEEMLLRGLERTLPGSRARDEGGSDYPPRNG